MVAIDEVKEINDALTEKVKSATDFFDVAYNDGLGSNPKDFEDDNFIHICRGRYRFVFYNGQEKGRLTEKDVPRFAKLVDKVIGGSKL